MEELHQDFGVEEWEGADDTLFLCEHHGLMHGTYCSQAVHERQYAAPQTWKKMTSIVISIFTQPLQLLLLHQPSFQATCQHPLLLPGPALLQRIIVLIPVHRPPIPATLLFHSNKTFLVLERQALLVLRPVPRADYVLLRFGARTVSEFPGLAIGIYPIQFGFRGRRVWG